MAIVVVNTARYGNFKERIVCRRSSGLIVRVSIAKADSVERSRRDIPMLKSIDSSVILMVPKSGMPVMLYRSVEPCWLANIFIMIMIIESHRASCTKENHSFVIFPSIAKGIVERKRSRSNKGSLMMMLPNNTANTQRILHAG